MVLAPFLLAAIGLAAGSPAPVAAEGAGLGLLLTALTLGIRHGIDWDHIAAISDITSTTAAADHGEQHHLLEHERTHRHVHAHGGRSELSAHEANHAGSS